MESRETSGSCLPFKGEVPAVSPAEGFESPFPIYKGACRMRIMVLSDIADKALWDYLDRSLLEGVDLVLSCGDLPAEYLSFLTCFTHAPILYVHGNHDEGYAKKPPEGCICIEDDIYVHEGVRILGLGGSMRYRPGEHMYSEKEMRKRVRRLWWKLRRHRGFDILLAHAPASGIGDQPDLPHRGFQVFVELMDKWQPKYMVYGHVHPQYAALSFQRERTHGSTTCVNAYKRAFIEI